MISSFGCSIFGTTTILLAFLPSLMNPCTRVLMFWASQPVLPFGWLRTDKHTRIVCVCLCVYASLCMHTFLRRATSRSHNATVTVCMRRAALHPDSLPAISSPQIYRLNKHTKSKRFYPTYSHIHPNVPMLLLLNTLAAGTGSACKAKRLAISPLPEKGHSCRDSERPPSSDAGVIGKLAGSLCSECHFTPIQLERYAMLTVFLILLLLLSLE